ncbi:Golgi reassembly stacking protein, putative [Talaromyces stipitatus ATCC 10500]|uniref:Golgi reassembly stacking protein, putative n=1 Tax=Talaromyces stipitatus (strain ATCC 10500 / CBS 375.48 / QM 6759 / NRRL 1006) TaxID=441959 RepID=B8LYS8_TALSN|nr:Golgi reassembly stacking protein, putative [Talaromyces stipitatus ATCC 10500]EED23436.1 Golgi reassembly stacking protein, putative [Talaromyces stipitatus ATCC 10500]
MFGALNRFIGRLDSEAVQNDSHGHGDNSFGFQILRNKDGDLPLEPWFDFIIGINGHLIEPDHNLFVTEVRNCAGSSVSLEIWSAKGQRTHTISIPVSKENPSLGLTLQLAPLSVTQHIWHVLSIPSPLSPAYLAGLLEHSDYILGSPSGTLRGESALGELVEDHLNRSLVLWVYNSEFDVVREVELVPTRGWGGEGALGAVLGYGALHRLPVGLGEEVEGPGEVVFETKEDGQEQLRDTPAYNTNPISPTGNYLVPANMASPPPLSSPTSSLNSPAPPRSNKPGRRNRHAGISPSKTFDEYFAEGEQKSKEEDIIPSRKGAPLAPPPKAGDPPQQIQAGTNEEESVSAGQT